MQSWLFLSAVEFVMAASILLFITDDNKSKAETGLLKSRVKRGQSHEVLQQNQARSLDF